MEKIRSGQSFLYRQNGYNSTVIEVKMKERIRGDYLQVALGNAIQRFPYMADKLVEKKGTYYLHHNDVSINAVKTNKFRTLGSMATGYHLLDVTFDKNSIKVAFHHALCDGRGVKPFIETMVYYYCKLKYKKVFSTEGIHTIDEGMDIGEIAEPFGTKFYPVDESKVVTVNNDGFALPESTSAPRVCNRTEILINEQEFVNKAKRYGSSPGVFAATLLSSSIYQLHPQTDKPIVCSMATDLRTAIGAENTHRNCTASLYLPYSKDDENSEIIDLCSKYKKLLLAQKNKDSVMKMINKQIGLFNKLDSIGTLEEKRKMLSFFEGMCINTYVISYLGKMCFNDFDQYVESTHLYCGGIKGLTVNMVAAGGNISFDILQGFEGDSYVRSFINKLEEQGIAYKSTGVFAITTGKDKSHITSRRQAERYYA